MLLVGASYGFNLETACETGSVATLPSKWWQWVGRPCDSFGSEAKMRIDDDFFMV